MEITPAGDPVQIGNSTVWIRSGPEAGTQTIAVSGALDLENALAVDAELRRLEGEDGDRIVLDLGELDFIDSTGIAMLLSAATRSAASGRLRVGRPRSADVNRLLDLTGVGPRLPYR